jgi:hypothetical protein
MDFKTIVQSPEYGFIRTEPRLGERIILLGVSGSYGYGTNREGSDIDLRGVTLNLPSDLIGLTSFEQYEDRKTDTVIYSFNKLVSLLMNCNPNTIEILGLDDEQYVIMTPIGRELIDNRGLFELDLAIETYLMTTLLGTSGLGSATYANGGNVSADDIFAAMMTVKGASNYNADAIVINPADYQRLRLAKDNSGAGQYYGGGYFYGPYGNGGTAQQPGLWGLNTVITSSITAGTVLVGAFKQGASVITKSGEGQRVEVVTGDHDDRTHNRVTVIVEERLGLVTRVPSAFVKITEAAS